MTNKLISGITAFLVFILAVGAFVLSYSALRVLAAENGLSGWQSYLWPLMIDFALVVCSLAVLRANLQNERAVYPWLLVFLYSASTIGFNVIHAPDNLIARLVAVVAPVSLFLSFELFVSMLRAEVKRHNALKSLETIKKEIEHLSYEKNRLEGLTARLTGEIKDLRQEKREYKFYVGEETIEQAKTILAERPDLNGSQLGKELGRSASLGRRLKRSLSKNGKAK